MVEAGSVVEARVVGNINAKQAGKKDEKKETRYDTQGRSVNGI